jgi:hypothetical protein
MNNNYEDPDESNSGVETLGRDHNLLSLQAFIYFKHAGREYPGMER